MVNTPRKYNDKFRRQWVDNDQTLYSLQQQSGLGMVDFIIVNRDMIDKHIDACKPKSISAAQFSPVPSMLTVKLRRAGRPRKNPT